MQTNSNPAVRSFALSERTFLRYFTFIALYFAQGIPEGLLGIGVPAWMAMNGKSPGEIGTFSAIILIPWSFKFVVAPMMDRYTFLPMGRKRPWILLGQVGLVASCIWTGLIPDPLNHMDQLSMACFWVSFFGAFQDVATDGMAIDIIPQEQQAKANGLMWGSKVIGMSSALAVGTWIMTQYSFKTAMLGLAAVVGLMMLAPLLLRERPGERLMPWSRGEASPLTQKLQVPNWKVLFLSLWSVLRLRNSLLIGLLLVFSAATFKYINTLLPVFTVKALGWTNVEYSNTAATTKLIGGIIGMLLGGILIDRVGKKRMLHIYFGCTVALMALLAFSGGHWSNRNFIFAFLLGQHVLYTFVSIAVFAVAMQCCWKKVSASQFTFFMTITNLGQMAAAALVGPIKASFSWEMSLLACGVFCLLAWLVLPLLNIDRHIVRVAELEAKSLAADSR